jgi:hypothetical protein
VQANELPIAPGVRIHADRCYDVCRTVGFNHAL